MADIAREAGVTRVTLYRRGETRSAIIAALRNELATEERSLLLPILASVGDARTRLEHALKCLCSIADDRAELLAGLDDTALNAIYHEPSGRALTRREFIDPIVRLLIDGTRDGSLSTFKDPTEKATVLYGQVFYGYLHLRREHRWSARRATDAVVELALEGLSAHPYPPPDEHGRPELAARRRRK